MRIMEKLRAGVHVNRVFKTADDVKDLLREALVEALLAGDEGYFSPLKMLLPMRPPYIWWSGSTASRKNDQHR